MPTCGRVELGVDRPSDFGVRVREVGGHRLNRSRRAVETSGAFTDAHAINDRGQIVGANPVAGGHTHAVVVQDGFMTDLGSLGGDSSAVDINERGMAVGTSSDASGTEHAVPEDGDRLRVVLTTSHVRTAVTLTCTVR